MLPAIEGDPFPDRPFLQYRYDYRYGYGGPLTEMRRDGYRFCA
jgi:hypothetical protein